MMCVRSGRVLQGERIGVESELMPALGSILESHTRRYSAAMLERLLHTPVEDSGRVDDA
jgi:hypothetical protein